MLNSVYHDTYPCILNTSFIYAWNFILIILNFVLIWNDIAIYSFKHFGWEVECSNNISFASFLLIDNLIIVWDSAIIKFNYNLPLIYFRLIMTLFYYLSTVQIFTCGGITLNSENNLIYFYANFLVHSANTMSQIIFFYRCYTSLCILHIMTSVVLKINIQLSCRVFFFIKFVSLEQCP